MKEYKIITITPASKTTAPSMEGYIKSCETSLNQLAKEGWKLVCTESIAQQDLSNIILFMEREQGEAEALIQYESHSMPEERSETQQIIIEHPDPESLSKN